MEGRDVKGLIFDLVESVVVGESTWDALLDDAGLDGVYTTVGSYPDAELEALVQAACRRLDLSRTEVLRWVGRQAMPSILERYPAFFSPPDARAFVLTLNDVIHPEVRKLHPGADVPEFDFEQPADERLVIGYGSRRRMCGFAEGLVLGAADHYGERVAIRQSACMLEGDASCRIECTFGPGG